MVHLGRMIFPKLLLLLLATTTMMPGVLARSKCKESDAVLDGEEVTLVDALYGEELPFHKAEGTVEQQQENKKKKEEQKEKQVKALDMQGQQDIPKRPARRQRRALSATGTFNVLVLPIDWPDRPSDRILPTTEQLDELWNGVGEGDNYPSGSITNWTYTNSHGTLTLTATVAPWITADNTEIFYANGNSARHNDDPNAPKLSALLGYALDQLESQGFDFSPFDLNDDGYLDAVAMVHSGYGAEMKDNDCSNERGYLDRIQSQRSSGPPVEEGGWVTSDGAYTLGAFTVASAFMGTCNANIARLGIMVHEFIHVFGIPELYDVTKVSEGTASNVGGVGSFDPMGNPFGQGYRLALPGHLCAWTKYQLGWLQPMEITEDGSYTLRPSNLYPDAYVIDNPYPAGEYLLLEVRRPLLFDANMWQPGGLVIYHVDEQARGPGNQAGGYPGQEGWPGNGEHYTVAVLQQDGQYGLEQNLDDGGVSDFWTTGSFLGPGNGETIASTSIYPNTDSYQFGMIQVTGLIISDFIELPDGSVSFMVTGMPSDAVDAVTVFPTIANGGNSTGEDDLFQEDDTDGTDTGSDGGGGGSSGAYMKSGLWSLFGFWTFGSMLGLY